LKSVGERLCRPGEGVILRTVAEGESEQSLEMDMSVLRDQWQRIVQSAERARAPRELFHDVELVPRLIRDIFSEETDEFIVDDKEQLRQAHQVLESIAPRLRERVRLHTGKEAINEAFQVRKQLEQALQPKQWLSSGGYLVIDQTEALTVIDVNTGKFTGTTNLEETVFATNIEAVSEIARLLRLRDIGGIIIIDFIDMELDEHKRRIIQVLEEAVRRDRTKSHIIGWTKLGLLEMTRKKVREHKDTLYFEPCKACGGRGKIQTRTFV